MVLQEPGRPGRCCSAHKWRGGSHTAKLPVVSSASGGTERTQAHGSVTGVRRTTKRVGQGGRESERLIVATKPGNRPHRDPRERRGRWVKEPLEGNMTGAPNPESMSTGCQRIAELARQAPSMSFTSLAHHLDLRLLHEAYQRTRKD